MRWESKKNFQFPELSVFLFPKLKLLKAWKLHLKLLALINIVFFFFPICFVLNLIVQKNLKGAKSEKTRNKVQSRRTSGDKKVFQLNILLISFVFRRIAWNDRMALCNVPKLLVKQSIEINMETFRDTLMRVSFIIWTFTSRSSSGLLSARRGFFSFPGR